MAEHGSDEWLKEAPEGELEKTYAQGPTEDLARRIKFELDRRKQERQDRISKRSMWAGVAGGTAALASAFVAVTQLIVPTSRELAEVEVLRREIAAVYKDCHDKSFNLALSIRTPLLPIKLTDRQAFIIDELEEMRKDAFKFSTSGREDYKRNLYALADMPRRSMIELERERTDALLCVEVIESYSERHIELQEEIERWQVDQ